MTQTTAGEMHRLLGPIEQALGVLADAESRAPRRAAGADPTGTVRMRLGPDGTAEAIEVAADWAETLRPEQFGAAVLAADADATQRRTAAWSTALAARDPWDDPPPVRIPVPPVASPAGRRAPDEIGEDLIRAADVILAYARDPGPAPTGTGHHGGLTVTVGQYRLVSCTSDPQWTYHQSGGTLASAFGQALAAARRDLAEALSAPHPTDCLDPLLRELGLSQEVTR
ncbi:MAG: hypothetical protein J2P15_08985 [Micromonosporaceae bacterium]|nr:hypothetical protein [Micromonosporaceae bacterium]